MPACNQVKLLLGPFDDGELEPHEMEDVAFHVVTCGTCKAALEDYRSLGVALRDCFIQPAAAGFNEAVMERIAGIRQPLRIRIRNRLDWFADSISGGLALTAAGAFAALVTVWIVSPYAHRLLVPESGMRLTSNHPGAGSPPYNSANPTPVAGGPSQPGGMQMTSGNQAAPDGQSMITLLNDNDPATTVIWVPDQP